MILIRAHPLRGKVKIGFGGCTDRLEPPTDVNLGMAFTAEVPGISGLSSFVAPSNYAQLGRSAANHKPTNWIGGNQATDFAPKLFESRHVFPWFLRNILSKLCLEVWRIWGLPKSLAPHTRLSGQSSRRRDRRCVKPWISRSSGFQHAFSVEATVKRVARFEQPWS